MIHFRLIRQLWLFLAVAEKEHFGRAAEALGIAQPPLTEQIKLLEHALKVPLFERSRRDTQLTPQGRAILPAVRKFAEQMRQLEESVQAALQGQTGMLAVGATTQAMTDVLADFLPYLESVRPQLRVTVREIDSAQALPLLRGGEIDLAFVRREGAPEAGAAERVLKQDRLAVALHSRHRLFGRETVSLAELADEDWVMLERQVSPAVFDAVVAACVRYGFSPRIRHEVRSVAAQIAFVACAQGSALVPYSLHKTAPANVRLVPVAENVLLTTTAAVWLPERSHLLQQEALQALDDWLAEI